MTSLDNLSSWHSDWKSQKAIVYGVGVSGFSVADTLHELGVELLVIADQIDSQHSDLLSVLGINFVEGLSASDAVEAAQAFKADFAVVSPGIRPSNVLVKWFEANDVAVIGDIELAWRLQDKAKSPQWVLITGTNGKTTTTQLVESMLIADGKRAIACGNIGTPILDAIREPEGFDFLVVELSSFQLHYLNRIAPKVSAILNIAEDHIDWHGSFDEYAAVKGKVFNGTTHAIIFNAQDVKTRELAEGADVRDENVLAVSFTRGMPADLQVGFVEEFLIDRAFYGYRAAELPELASLEDIQLIGVVTPHLLSNVAAAAAIARACDVEASSIKAAIREFKLDRHRIEFVGQSRGVLWFDDSKATNAHAAEASLKSFESVVWIVGGLLKGIDIAPLVAANAGVLKAAVVIGKDRAEVLDALAQFAPNCAVSEIEDQEDVMAAAVAAAERLAAEGDVVLLAPAAASMDQFKDYADRGNQFADAVRGIISGN
jgi:UDP-N-acetylmuramoylalanine--D-glutamate ligase